MKYRTDFVTNSSSSSFILSFGESMEDVYQFVLNLFKEYREKIKYLYQLCEIEDYAFTIKDKKIIARNGESLWSKNNYEKARNLEKLTEISLFENTVTNISLLDWIDKCPTYKDYLKYWKNLMYIQDYDYHIHAPFSICDYTEDTMDILHYRPSDYIDKKYILRKDSKEKIDKSIENNEVQWYLDELYEDENLEEIKNLEPAILLGRFAILSECGYIPEYVVERLIENSKFACNHMG